MQPSFSNIAGFGCRIALILIMASILGSFSLFTQSIVVDYVVKISDPTLHAL